MKKFLKLFFRPSIAGKFVSRGRKVKVSISNLDKQDSFTLMFMILKEVAKYLGMDHRELLNKLKDLDTQIKKNEKTEVKKAKYGK